MPRFSNKINWETDKVSFYKFVCKDVDILYTYIGHTTNFATRKSQHKSVCSNSKTKNYNFPIYLFIREHGGWCNWNMVQIHSQICKDALHAKQIEQELIDKERFKLNNNKSYTGITLEEYQKQYRKTQANKKLFLKPVLQIMPSFECDEKYADENWRCSIAANEICISFQDEDDETILVTESDANEEPAVFTDKEMNIYRKINAYKRRQLRLKKQP